MIIPFPSAPLKHYSRDLPPTAQFGGSSSKTPTKPGDLVGPGVFEQVKSSHTVLDAGSLGPDLPPPCTPGQTEPGHTPSHY